MEYRVTKWRRNAKAKLVEEFGGKCAICGYARYQGSLQFHHRDPATKEFGIGRGTVVGYERMRAEATKCVLVCGNCHAEIHAGIIAIDSV